MFPRLRFAARWSWLLWLPLSLLLLVQLLGLRRESRLRHNQVEAFNKNISTLKAQIAAAKPRAPSVYSEPQKTDKTPATRPRLRGWSDRDAMNDADYGLVIARRQRRYAMGNYRAAIDALKLSPADAERLKTLVIAGWNAGVDTADVLSHMENASGGLRDKAEKAARAEAEQEIKGFLGDEAYAKFKGSYDSSLANTGTWILSTAMWDAGLPMSTEQEAAFKEAQYETSPLLRPETENPIDPQTGLRRADLELLEKVRAFLSPAQVAFIRSEKLEDARYRSLVDELQRTKSTSPTGTH